jgi:phosphopantothenoylcysteine synthetase/decarboxylase
VVAGPVLGLVCCGAGGVESIRAELVESFLAEGWTVAVTATPAAYRWLADMGEVDLIEKITRLPVRHAPRLPREESPHPAADCYAVVPASANTVAKLALGVADNQALTQVCEALGGRVPPVVVFPRVNAAHAGHPAWNGHLDALRQAGAILVWGEDVWPLSQPRSSPGPPLPWDAIRSAIRAAVMATQ